MLLLVGSSVFLLMSIFGKIFVIEVVEGVVVDFFRFLLFLGGGFFFLNKIVRNVLYYCYFVNSVVVFIISFFLFLELSGVDGVGVVFGRGDICEFVCFF